MAVRVKGGGKKADPVAQAATTGAEAGAKAAAPKVKKPRKKEEAYFTERYTHAVPGSLQFEDTVNKQSMEVACTVNGCPNKRRVYTSDIFQVKLCLEHAKQKRSASRKKKKEDEPATAPA